MHFAINAQFVERHWNSGLRSEGDEKYCSTDPSDGVYYCSNDKENLEKFADYVYEYHFLYPKTSRPKEISYPTVGLNTYLELMSHGVAANLAAGASNAARQFGILNNNYLKDYQDNLKLFKDNAINTANNNVISAIDAEIAKVNQQLGQNEALRAMLDSSSLEGKLGLNGAGVASGAGNSTSGKSSSSLTSAQNSYANAVRDLRQARKNQMNKLDYYKKAMAKNPGRASKMAVASKNFSNSFLRPLTGSGSGSGYGGSGIGGRGYGAGGSGFGSGNGSGSGSGNGSGDGDGNGDGKNGANGQNLGLNAPGTYPGADGMYDPNANGNGNGSGSKSKSGSGSGADSGLAGANGAGNGNGLSEDDARRLSDAIDARDKNKDKYRSQDGLSIFERVTNAYIRNYDKVLEKKKKSDKDVIEKN
jgi:hypothetical protein